ncbi:MAG: 5-formyltetrahydrofolate cyclo-ligase [Deltaproteobacteria bacterium]|nr:5-formyltetrahydrofolate cyclo-ligase [Deltaproteobacteria bacterium]
MEDIKEKKLEIRKNIETIINKLSDVEIAKKREIIRNRLFEFANFVEAKIALLYIARGIEVDTMKVIKKCCEKNKVVVIPVFGTDKYKVNLFKVDHPDTDLKLGLNGILEPDANRCKIVPIDCIDIAIIPGVAFDEKGGRIGLGEGYYDRLIPKLPITTRKVAVAFEEQIIQQVPMASHDKYVDIIISDKRVIYKI